MESLHRIMTLSPTSVTVLAPPLSNSFLTEAPDGASSSGQPTAANRTILVLNGKDSSADEKSEEKERFHEVGKMDSSFAALHITQLEIERLSGHLNLPQ